MYSSYLKENKDSNLPRSPKMSLLYSCSKVVANVNGDPKATDHPRATSVARPSTSWLPKVVECII